MISGAPARTRTVDQLIKSQLLYQLSYRGNKPENIGDNALFVFSLFVIAYRHLIPYDNGTYDIIKHHQNGGCKDR